MGKASLEMLYRTQEIFFGHFQSNMFEACACVFIIFFNGAFFL